MPHFTSPHASTPTPAGPPNRTPQPASAHPGTRTAPPAPPATASRHDTTSQPVRIPADVDCPDQILAGLTARQLLILSVIGIVLCAVWSATRGVVALPVFLLGAIPLGVSAVILVLGQRDGISLDRLTLAAIHQRLSPRYRVTAPEGVHPVPRWLATRVSTTAGDPPTTASPAALDLPAVGVSEAGVVDLGADGLALVAVCSTVNFALRTPAEQESLVAGFGRYLHSLTAPVQVLVRAQRLDLSKQIAELSEAAGGLAHPALEQAAREHADYLAHLAQTRDLLRRQVLLVLREPLSTPGCVDGLGGTSPVPPLLAKARRSRGHATEAARHTAEARLIRRLGEASDLLRPAGITVTALDAGQATAVLAASCNPDSLIPPSAGLAGADDVITTAAGDDECPEEWGQAA
ncbi:MAG: PrgI family protein [Pseudonocardiales bacterium]|nr:PrgI family protein [Pseudonocardiales bacterium]